MGGSKAREGADRARGVGGQRRLRHALSREPAADLEAAKRSLRARMQAQLGVADPGWAGAAAAAAAARLAAMPEYAGASRVALYAALPSELSTRPLFDAVRRDGKTALFPRTHSERRVLEFIAAARWEELEPGRYGVREPPSGTPVHLTPGDLVIVPGLAFDAAGHRLGRGSGWFDRTFPPSGRPGPLLVGYAYERQLVESVPSGPTDRCMDWIVTEQAARRASAAERGEWKRPR